MQRCPSISEFLGFDGEQVRCSLPIGHDNEHIAPEGRFRQVWDSSRIKVAKSSADYLEEVPA